MTVTSLWTVLDDAGCGAPVGVEDFDLRGRGARPENQSLVAVDLSLWICEGLASAALTSFHAHPALHLVYQRATTLLKLGLGLVFVAEGQRREWSQAPAAASSSSPSAPTHALRPRRAGSAFWDASRRCEAMLRCLGVPVVRAEAEGEALCALLSARGIVDGVVSNDGDALLYGARVVYAGTFSAENLVHRRVRRYDAATLRARLVDDGGPSRTVRLSREDLVAFAMLCGSDVCGEGVPHVGHRKAVRFLHACRSLKERADDRTCLDELLSWADEPAAPATSADVCVDCDDDGPGTIIPSRHCSLCLHPGDKLQHEKHGCAACGTGPGEGCFVVTSSERVLRSLREKARGRLAPRRRVEAYFSPNGDAGVSASLLRSLTSKPYSVTVDVAGLLGGLVLKGRCEESAREHVARTLPKLLARLDMWDTRPRNVYVTSKQRYKPIPKRIERSLVRRARPCYEITWSINMHPTLEEEQRFSTVECRALVDANLPWLVRAFQQEERRRQQGRAEDDRRAMFAGTTKHAARRQQHRNQARRREQAHRRQRHGGTRKRERNFDADRPRPSKVPRASAVEREPSHDVSLLMNNLQHDDPLAGENPLECGESGGKGCGPAQDCTIDSEGFGDAIGNSVSIAEQEACILDAVGSRDDIGDSVSVAEQEAKLVSSDDVGDSISVADEEATAVDVDSVIEDLFGGAIDGIAYPSDYLCSKGPIQHLDEDALDCSSVPFLPSPPAMDTHCDDYDYKLSTYEDVAGESHHQLFLQSPEEGTWDEMKEQTISSQDHFHPKDPEQHLGWLGRDDLSHPNMAMETHHQSLAMLEDVCSCDVAGKSSGVPLLAVPCGMSPGQRVFCDMGIQIEVTPIVSRRWRVF